MDEKDPVTELEPIKKDSSQDYSDESYQETSFSSNYTSSFWVQLTWAWVQVIDLNLRFFLYTYFGMGRPRLKPFVSIQSLLTYITLLVSLGLYMLLTSFTETLML